MRPAGLHGEPRCYHNVMLNIPYAEVARILEGAGAELPAAEAHGCLCGALCAADDYSLGQWLAEIASDPASGFPLNGPDSPLRMLFDSTVRDLRGDSLEFTPLLPDDGIALAYRTEALAQWAQGFLYGLAAGEIGRRPDLPQTVTEVLGDFAEIGRATVSGPDDAVDEADEEAFAELYEFVRVGVQLVYDELLPLRRV